MNEKIKIEYLSPTDLIPYENNPRIHSDAQIEKLIESVKEYGVVLPVLIDDNNLIISHHAVVTACLKLELSEIPCVRASHLNEAQKLAYIIADNRLAEDSTWDRSMLKTEMLKLRDDFGLELEAKVLERESKARQAKYRADAMERELLNNDLREEIREIPIRVLKRVKLYDPENRKYVTEAVNSVVNEILNGCESS